MKHRLSLAAVSAVALFTAGAIAQTAPQPSPAPRNPAPMNSPVTAIAPGEFLSTKLVGAAVYVPKAGSTTIVRTSPNTTTTTGAPAVEIVRFQPVTKADWTRMKDQHETIGEIENLVIGADGQVKHVIVGVGGFLGMGEKWVAMDLSQLQLMRDEDGTLYVTTARTRDELKAMPSFKTDRAS